jgi:hypothetical protein
MERGTRVREEVDKRQKPEARTQPRPTKTKDIEHGKDDNTDDTDARQPNLQSNTWKDELGSVK